MSAPFRLIDPQRQAHLKFQGREPRRLQELLVAKADAEHRRRLAEVKCLAKKLDLLEAFLPALAAAGVDIAQREFCTYNGGKTLRIQPTIFQSDDKLYAALVKLGFREVKRQDYGCGQDQVQMKHGRWLVVAIDVTKKVAEVPA